jgi:2,3-bisphosphoglycerate-independent phosphoglycerate mutase
MAPIAGNPNKPGGKPVVLIVRDGWGANPHPEWNHANAVYLAHTPVDRQLMDSFPHVLIKTHGHDVGLPVGVMGNSEVGHQNIGAGRIVEQEIMRITGRIHDGTFFRNDVLVGAFDRARKTNGRVHLMGLCSDGRVHSDLDHLYGLLDLSVRCGFPGRRVFVHAFTDGRDTDPRGGLRYLEAVEAKCRETGVNPVASVIGRYYAMDRDHRWDRVERAYRLLTLGEGRRFPTALAAIRHAYEHPAGPTQTGDEFIEPCTIAAEKGQEPVRIENGDSVIFFNYRGDRPRQLTAAFVLDDFPYEGTGKDGVKARRGFQRGPKPDLYFATLTDYEKGLPVHVAFDKPAAMTDILGEYVSRRGLRQFRCAETEKYPHVTFFFNDYRDPPFPGEERAIVPSPRDVATYDQKPEMSAREVTRVVLDRIAAGDDDLLVINFANGDMVGHTGNLAAAVRAVEVVDECVGRIVEAVQARGGVLLVTADHGNCEQMVDPLTGKPHTAHTTYDVECIVVGDAFRGRALRTGGRLADVAPTLLTLMGLPIPEAMTGRSLLLTN